MYVFMGKTVPLAFNYTASPNIMFNFIKLIPQGRHGQAKTLVHANKLGKAATGSEPAQVYSVYPSKLACSNSFIHVLSLTPEQRARSCSNP